MRLVHGDSANVLDVDDLQQNTRIRRGDFVDPVRFRKPQSIREVRVGMERVLSTEQQARQDEAQQGKRYNNAQDLLLTHVLSSSTEGILNGFSYANGLAA